MTAPATYSDAKAQARLITWDEFAGIIATDDNPYVYPRPRALRRIAMNVRVHLLDRPAITFGSFDYCNRNGFGAIGAAGPEGIWHFDTAGTVQVASRSSY